MSLLGGVVAVASCSAMPWAMRRGLSELGDEIRFGAVDYGVIGIGAIAGTTCFVRGDAGGAVLCASVAISSLTDIRNGVVLDRVLVVTLAAIAIVAFVAGGVPAAALGGAVGLLVMGSVWALGRGAMGLGDVKLAGVIGAELGFERGLAALAIAFVLGGLVAAVLLVLGRVRRGEALPFAPYLAVAATVVACNILPATILG